jgi:hypothetical protein
MTIFMFANNVDTTLAGPISSTATSLTLASTAFLPASIPSGQVLVITLNDQATRQNFEVIYATAISGATLSGLLRAQEGTSALSWSTGDYAYNSPTAGQQENFGQLPEANTWTGSNVFSQPLVVANAVENNEAVALGQLTGAIFIKVTVFQSSSTWTPNPLTTRIKVRMVGGGGGGGSGGGCGSDQTAVGGGGGAGAYHEFIIANPGAQAITIGSGGIAGANGGVTSFGSISSCPGGGGAVFVNATAFTGAYNQGISGAGAAAPSNIVGTVITAGGASGDPGLALRVDSAVGGAGGDSVYGGGGRYSNQSAGFNASAPGAGGSGASVGQNTSSLTGGVGANGILILEEFM